VSPVAVELEGEIVFEDVDSAVRGATAHVRLLDVTRADAASLTLAEATIADVCVDPGPGRPLRFALAVPALPEQGRQSLSVHVDVDNSGSVTRGDYVTVESFPVPRPLADQPFLLRVRPVR